ncbi:Retrovirus-related Pol polyprotein [Stylophora pistillata]|uniref:Retrovirus-related Pol polyprotein n=1 Tax=Stylophora pistillata TaxID=50429 RepID=A0A2B4RXF5_STYPI|nr:Retrovirus-related Pol polyprotein [Stylophora pistillata]
MERPEQVNKLCPNDRQAKKKGMKGKKPGKERKCYWCGRTGHLAKEESCPALHKTCNKCGKSGHFAAGCKTKSTKKPSGRYRSEGANKVSEEKEEEEDHYALVLDTKSSNGSSGAVDLFVGAPEKYQKIVKDVLIGCKGVASIADDLIIHGWGIKEHDGNLLTVLRRLRERGLTLNEKCQFRLLKLTFFGHDFSSKGIAPCEEKVSAVQNAKPPQSNAENADEKKTEKEGLALVWASERFKLCVFGREFEQETDHKPLQCIYNKSSKPSARIERWVLCLQGYNFKVIYRPGKTNIADALSRLNSVNQKNCSGEEADFVRVHAQESTPVAMTAKEVERESENNPELCSFGHYIQSVAQGQPPAFLMLGRELKIKLPELRPNKSAQEESTRYRDWNQKPTGKMYNDKQRHDVDNPITLGDKGLLKNTKQSGKLAANFQPNPYTVQTKEGQELTLKSTDGTVQRRHSSFVKPYRTPQEPDNSTGAETLEDRMVPPSVTDRATTTEPKSRPSRTVQMPPQFKDFVLDR